MTGNSTLDTPASAVATILIGWARCHTAVKQVAKLALFVFQASARRKPKVPKVRAHSTNCVFTQLMKTVHNGRKSATNR